MAGCTIRAGGVHTYPKVGVNAYRVGLRKDGKMQADDKVYDNPNDFSKRKENEKAKPEDDTKPAVVFTLTHYDKTWPPVDQDRQEEVKVEGKVKVRRYEIVEGERDDQGRSELDPQVDEWTVGRSTWTEDH